jgi:hypothetical protein
MILFNRIGYIALNDRMVNYEFERLQKRAVVKVLVQYLHVGTEGNNDKLQ